MSNFVEKGLIDEDSLEITPSSIEEYENFFANELINAESIIHVAQSSKINTGYYSVEPNNILNRYNTQRGRMLGNVFEAMGAKIVLSCIEGRYRPVVFICGKNGLGLMFVEE